MTRSALPSPISWAPSQWWDGIDGEWSSFDLRVGSSDQPVRVLPSTAGSATWLVTSGGCDPPSSECSQARGGLFDLSKSSSWQEFGNFTLALEMNLGHNESATFGLDTMSLGLSNATGGPTLDSQIIAGLRTEHWYIGLLGLQQQPQNLSDFSHPHQSFLSTLRARNLIPSLSWSYTAGAHYRSKGSFGSLTFGGSDASRYSPSNVSFTLAPDIQRDLVVGIQSITSTYINGSVSSLLPSPTLAFIDSTVPYLYLPEDACKTFESELGLVYNEKNNIYFVDDSLHQKLLASNPQFTFRLGNDKLSKPTVDITLPYASFDLVFKPPIRPNATSYFPLRRGTDDQITLGRAFLQEAYIITNYDQKNFTIAQTLFNDIAQSNIIPIPWNATIAPNSGDHLNRGARIGIGIGSAIFALLLAAFVFFTIRRWRRNRTLTQLTNQKLQDSPIARPFSSIPVQEMDIPTVRELHDNPLGRPELLDPNNPSGSGNNINEMAYSGGTSLRELSASPMYRNHELSSDSRSRSSDTPIMLDTKTPVVNPRTSNIVYLPLTPRSSEDISSTKKSWGNQGSTVAAARNSSHTRSKLGINKPLPHVPDTPYDISYTSSLRR